MRLVIQRVKSAQVTVAGEVVGQIGAGLLVFLGVAKGDSQEDADYLVKKIVELRLFEDPNGKMNLAAAQVNAAFLIVSQFTLLGNCDKGRRPSFDEAADPANGEELYNYFVAHLKKSNLDVATGRFRAMMDVSLINDGPVTFILDSNHATH
jgi:D-aminoacyl-tRNA deacylase